MIMEATDNFELYAKRQFRHPEGGNLRLQLRGPIWDDAELEVKNGNLELNRSAQDSNKGRVQY